MLKTRLNVIIKFQPVNYSTVEHACVFPDRPSQTHDPTLSTQKNMSLIMHFWFFKKYSYIANPLQQESFIIVFL